MSRAIASTVEDDLYSGKLWTVQYTTATMIAATGQELIGITIGEKDVVYQARTYTGTTVDCLVSLYQNSYTGGVLIPSGNRNLKVTLAGPAVHFSGITGTPTVFRTSIRLIANADKQPIGSVPEGEWYLLTAGTSYILRIQNLGEAGFLNFRFTHKAVD